MNEDQFLAGLFSPLPSERMRAAQRALKNPPSSEHRSALVDAVAREGVPRIRTAIGLVLKRIDERDAAFGESSSRTDGTTQDVRVILDELSGIIRHEMEPAIGWVRYSASREIAEFEVSATNRAMEALRRRIDGLTNLAAAHRVAVRKVVSLSELLSASMSSEYPSSIFTIEPIGDQSDDLLTDPGLMTLILTNAIHNAVEASRDLRPEDAKILIAIGITEKDFWFRVTNRFAGVAFDYSSVSATGRTSKQGHRGLGLRIVDLATKRLGYEFELKATGSMATFVLRGRRFV